MLKIDSLPRNHDLYYWTDFVELMCLVSPDLEISMEDIMDRMNDMSLSDTPANSDTNQLKDQREADADEWFRDIEFRINAFGEYYPFSFDTGNEMLFLSRDMNPQQKLYIFLLIASNLRFISGTLRHKFTSGFEVLSLEVLKMCLPDIAEVHLFGSSNSATAPHYSGRLWDKVNLLAQDLGDNIKIEEEEFSAKNTGDKGLDLVGWVPTFDNQPSRIVIFAQCACTDEWTKKQHSSHKSAWSNTIDFTVGPNNAVIIPICFRKVSGAFYRKSDIHDSVLIDRLRFVHLLGKKHLILQDLPVYNDMEEIINNKESIF